MADANLTPARLRELLHYDPETGVFTWRVARRWPAVAGSIAGGLTAKGYLGIRVDSVKYMAHRLAWLYVHGEWPARQIDHLNGVRNDNRLANLRDVSGAVNSQNQRKARSSSSSGMMGVAFHKRKKVWRAIIKVAGKTVEIGTYPTAQAAHDAYVMKKREVHPGCTI